MSPYDRDGFLELKDKGLGRTKIVECSSECRFVSSYHSQAPSRCYKYSRPVVIAHSTLINHSCKKSCGMRLAQGGVNANLQLVANAKGLGVITREELYKGQFVCIYAAEIVTEDEAKRREMGYVQAAVADFDAAEVVASAPSPTKASGNEGREKRRGGKAKAKKPRHSETGTLAGGAGSSSSRSDSSDGSDSSDDELESEEVAKYRAQMEADGWSFNPKGPTESHRMIGQRTRRFFRHLVCKANPYGHCDGMLVAYIPADGEDFALWKNQHKDGTLEDLEEHEMRKAAKHIHSKAPPKNEFDNFGDESDDEVLAEAEEEGSGKGKGKERASPARRAMPASPLQPNSNVSSPACGGGSSKKRRRGTFGWSKRVPTSASTKVLVSSPSRELLSKSPTSHLPSPCQGGGPPPSYAQATACSSGWGSVESSFDPPSPRKRKRQGVVNIVNDENTCGCGKRQPTANHQKSCDGIPRLPEAAGNKAFVRKHVTQMQSTYASLAAGWFGISGAELAKYAAEGCMGMNKIRLIDGYVLKLRGIEVQRASKLRVAKRKSALPSSQTKSSEQSPSPQKRKLAKPAASASCSSSNLVGGGGGPDGTSAKMAVRLDASPAASTRRVVAAAAATDPAGGSNNGERDGNIRTNSKEGR